MNASIVLTVVLAVGVGLSLGLLGGGGSILLIGFTVMMFATAIAMIRRRRVRDDLLSACDLPVARS